MAVIEDKTHSTPTLKLRHNYNIELWYDFRFLSALNTARNTNTIV